MPGWWNGSHEGLKSLDPQRSRGFKSCSGYKNIVRWRNWYAISEVDVGFRTHYGQYSGSNPVLTTNKKLKCMNVEYELNCLCGDWWFDLGIGYRKTNLHREFNHLITLSLIVFSIYIRWGKK